MLLVILTAAAADDEDDYDSELMDEIVSVLPNIHNANAMANEMNKPVEMSPLVVSHRAHGFDSNKPRVSKRL